MIEVSTKWDATFEKTKNTLSGTPAKELRTA